MLAACGGGGGTSYTPPPVTPPPSLNTGGVAVSAVKMVYDPSRRRLYATLDANDKTHPNSVAIIDVSTVALVTTIPVSNPPRVIRLSDDYKYLYVGVDSSGRVEKIDLATNAIASSLYLGSDPTFGNIMAGDIAVMPGHSDTIAVAWKYAGLANNGGVAIYDSGVQRPVTSAPYHIGGPDLITFGSTPDSIYAADTSVSDFSLIRMTVSADGVRVKDSLQSIFGYAYNDMLFDSGRVYSGSGAVVDPDGLKLFGQFEASGPMAVDATTKTASFFTSTDSANSQKTIIGISQFDTDTFLLKGTVKAEVPPNSYASALLQCGTGTLALLVVDRTSQEKSIRVGRVAATTPLSTTPTLDTLPANHLVFDSLRQRIYASVPSRAGAKGNTVAVINPVSKTIESFIFVGSEPNVLSLSPDSKYLYVGIDGAASVARVDLSRQAVDLQYPIAVQTTLPSAKPLGALAITVLPNDSRSAAVSARYLDGTSPYNAGLAVYDDDTLRSSTDSRIGDSIAFDDAGTTVYVTTLNAEVWIYSLDATGLSYIRTIPWASGNVYASMRYAAGDLYTTNGRRLDPSRPKLKGTYPIGLARGMVLDGNTAYFLSNTTNGKTAIFAFDRDSYVYTGYQLTSLPAGSGYDLVQCGIIGFAYATNPGIVVTRSTFSQTPSTGSDPTNLAVNHLLYDAARNVIYASVPSRAGAIGNSLVTIDPTTKTVTSSIYVGSEPGPLALSADGTLLYVGLDGSGSVVIVDIASRGVQSSFDIPYDMSEGQHFAWELAVKPDDANTVAVLKRRDWGWSSEYAGLALYQNGQALPAEVPIFGQDIGTIVFGPSSSELYGYNNSDTGFQFYKFQIDGSGVVMQNSSPGFISGFLATLSYYDGLIYASNGYTVDPSTDSTAGTFPGIDNSQGLANDVQHSYFLIWSQSVSPPASVKVYDRTTYTQVGSFTLPLLTAAPYDPIRYGVTGLAFATADDHIFFTDVPQLTAADVPLSQLPANHLVFDAARKRIYASVPGSSPARGNTITIIDPATATIEQSIAVGSEPSSLAISSDGLYLYVGLLGANVVKRINLNTHMVDESIPLGSDTSGPMVARSLSASPTDPNTFAAIKMYSHEFARVSIYNGASELPTQVTDNRFGFPDMITYSDLPSTLYGEGATYYNKIYLMTADNAGISLADSPSYQSVLGPIAFSGGLIYSAGGAVIDPKSMNVKSTFPVLGLGDGVVVDPARSRAVFVAHDSAGKVNVQAFDISSGQPTSSVEVSQATRFGTDIVRWGPSQYAISTPAGIFLLDGTVQ